MCSVIGRERVFDDVCLDAEPSVFVIWYGLFHCAIPRLVQPSTLSRFPYTTFKAPVTPFWFYVRSRAPSLAVVYLHAGRSVAPCI